MYTLNSLNTLHACVHKLPCGICEKLKEQCPVQNTVNYCRDDNLSNSASAHSYEGASVRKENEDG